MFDIKIFGEKNTPSSARNEKTPGSLKIHDKSAVYPRDELSHDQKKKEQHQQYRKNENDEAGDHFESLRTTVTLLNQEFLKKKTPYRFYLYKEFDNIYINLVRLGSDGSVAGVIRKNITHNEFSLLVRRIEEGEGLLFEMTG